MLTYSTSNAITGSTAITGGAYTDCSVFSSSTGTIHAPIDNYATQTYYYTTNPDATSNKSNKSNEPEFTYVKEYVPNKVYGFKINNDKNFIKTVCDDSDEFNLEFAFFLALAKYLYSSSYTFEGVLEKARELSLQKKYVKIVKEGIKLFKLLKKEEEKKEKYDKEQKQIRKNRNAKAKRRREAKLEKQKNLIKQAIIESKYEL